MSALRAFRSTIALIALTLSSAVIASAATETYYYFVFSNPTPGNETEYNRWYDHQHALDVVAVPGFATAQRFVVNDLPLYRTVDLQLPKYLIVYKIVTGDVNAVFAEVKRRLATHETVISPAFDKPSAAGFVYRVFRPEVKGGGGEPEGAKPGQKQLYEQIVFTAMVDGKEDEFNAFYDQHHAPELAAIPGFISAQRMILARPPDGTIPATKYLAVFNVETSDLAAVKKIAATPGTKSPAFDVAGTRGYTYRAIGPVIQGDHVRAARSSAR